IARRDLSFPGLVDETIIRGTAMRDRLASLIVRFALPLTLVLSASAAYAQAPAQTPGPPGPPDGVAALLNRLEQLLQQNDRDDFPALLSTADITGEEAEQATD